MSSVIIKMDDLTWYFAYGSNMKESRLEERDVQVHDSRTGYVRDFYFNYNKIGVDETGKGNIIPDSESVVWGVFFEISLKDYRHLHYMYEVGYREIDIEGISNGELIQAKSFTALPQKIDEAMIPSDKYHNTVITGAREKSLPEEYINSIEDRIIT